MTILVIVIAVAVCIGVIAVAVLRSGRDDFHERIEDWHDRFNR